MPDLLQVYDLGSKGIDLVNSPIHVEDTHLLSAQNAQTSPDDREGALRKRDGMVKINSIAAAGSLLAIVNITVT